MIPERRSLPFQDHHRLPGGNQEESPSSFELAIRATLRRWQWLTASGILSAVAAVAIAVGFTTLQYRYEGKLIYNRNDSTAPYFTSPAIETLAPWAKSRSALESVMREFHLAADIQQLESRIRIDVPPTGNALDVSLQWSDAQKTPAILARLMQLLVDRSREIRKDAEQRHITAFEADLTASEKKHSAAQARLQKALTDKGLGNVADIQPELSAVGKRLSEVEAALETAQLDLSATKAKLDQLNALAAKDAPAKPSAGSAPGAKGSTNPDEKNVGVDPAALPTDDVQARAYLRDMITDEQRRSANAALLRVKKSEFERAKLLYSRKVITTFELERVEGEYAALASQESDSIRNLRTQVRQIDRRIAAQPGGSRPGESRKFTESGAGRCTTSRRSIDHFVTGETASVSASDRRAA